jgi:hypothetical protein
MSPSLRQRLLEYARQLVDAKIAEKQLFAGNNVSIIDKMISLRQTGFVQPTEEYPDWYTTIYAESFLFTDDVQVGYFPLHLVAFKLPGSEIVNNADAIFWESTELRSGDETASKKTLQMRFFCRLATSLSSPSPSTTPFEATFPLNDTVEFVMAEWDQTASPPPTEPLDFRSVNIGPEGTSLLSFSVSPLAPSPLTLTELRPYEIDRL